ncbi:BTAD domain-containing putative transcriptional regulator [Streptomyces griseorubiginosus]|uniref:BTAD domain-containing putative transcriptional regulator n=1 Tax=Streptomyces griseorubiginosus TaxID=67304 RepID=UPI002E821300|nr:BTAD domain-containing putative transcriptional regulator [Streptomyces griseorubiginosus]WUB46929.1 AAA family ATPase [Streptomyces griseorubiginosus]WUB55451.1 AAA family ATPase [Streptomyces griseorubiginosus]
MLRIRVLGPLGAEVAGAPVGLGTPRQRAVLALLVAARGAVVSVDRMAEELWRGAPPARATVSLQAYVSNLRRVLEPERPPRAPAAVLVSSPPGYALRLPEDAVDAWCFGARVERARRAPAPQARKSLTEALGWWHGPAFQEHADEPWAAPEVARLSALRAEASELAVAAGLFTGHAAEVTPAAEAMVRERPLREEGWRLLALAHWATDRRGDALAALRRARRTLRDELGCDPSPTLTELEQAILAQRVEVLRAAVPERRGSGRGWTAMPERRAAGREWTAMPELRGAGREWAAGAPDHGGAVADGSLEAPEHAGGERGSRRAEPGRAHTWTATTPGQPEQAGTGGESRGADPERTHTWAATKPGQREQAGTGSELGEADPDRAHTWTATTPGRPEQEGTKGELGRAAPGRALPAAVFPPAASEQRHPRPESAQAGPGRARGAAEPPGASERTRTPAVPQEPHPTTPLAHDLFVGRVDELQALDSAALAARRGGGLVLVTGEAGAGKTALFGRLAGRLRGEGWTVVVGRCPEHEGAPPAWAWVEALGTLARLVPPARPDDVAALLHEPDGTAATTRDEATAGRFRLHRAFAAWLREAAAAEPVAVLLEDLHRADGQTLALLEAAAAVTGVPLLTVAGYRPAEVGEPLAKTLAHLAPRLPHRIALAGLSQRDVATVVDAVCGEPVDAATVASLAERTGGNPFYVRESARLLADEGALVAVSEVPQGVRDVLRRRLTLLSADARAAVQLAAVAGPESDVALLADAAETDEESVLAGLDAAMAADLLTEPGPGRVRFVHALVRDTVYTDLSGIRRARLHDRIARRLRTHRPDDLTALAHHFARSGRTANAPLAVDYALRAAELAERRYAHDVAVGLVRQALDAHTAATADPEAHPDGTVALLVRLLGAQVRAGATGAARHTRRQAVDLAVRAGRDDLAAVVYGAWAEPSPWRSRLEGFLDRTSLAHLERLAEDRTLDGPTRARVLQVLADAVAGEDARRARDAADAQLELARADGEPRLLASALMTSARLLPHEAQGAARTPLVDELRGLARDHDLPAHRWVCEHLDTLTAATRNDPDAVRRHTAAGLELAHRYRMRWAQGINTATSAMLAAVAGRFAEAEARYTEADGLFQRVGAHHATAPRTLGLWTIRLTQRREADLEPAVREVYESVGTPVAVAHALVLARLGRLDEAAAVPFPARPVTDHLYGMELDYRAELAVLLRDRDTAQSLIGALLPLKEQFAGAAGGAYVTRPLAHALADLYLFLGERGPAADAYALAERVARVWGSPHHLAAARRALGRLTGS